MGITRRGLGPGLRRDIRSDPILALILLKQFSEELEPLLVDQLGLSDKLRGASPEVSDEPVYDEMPDGLPLVAGSLITSTLSDDGVLGGLNS